MIYPDQIQIRMYLGDAYDTRNDGDFYLRNFNGISSKKSQRKPCDLIYTDGPRFCKLAASVNFWLTESKLHRIEVN